MNLTKIVGFTPGSRAKESGLNVGDVIRKVDGEPKDGLFYWNKALRWKAGDKVKVEVEREGKTVELEVELTAG
jgi:C-terminal processing protease CtpA/Prc